MRTLQTARLRLVPVTPSNARLLWEILQEPDLRDYQDLPDLSFEQFQRAVRERPSQLQPGVIGRFEWLVYYEKAKGPVGWISLRIADRTRLTGEIGYSVVREERGKGIATEAVSALVTEGFRAGQLSRVRAYCVPENLSSRAVLRQNGFEDEGVLPHGATVQGHPVDVVAHTLEREVWEERFSSSQSATGS